MRVATPTDNRGWRDLPVHKVHKAHKVIVVPLGFRVRKAYKVTLVLLGFRVRKVHKVCKAHLGRPSSSGATWRLRLETWERMERP